MFDRLNRRDCNECNHQCWVKNKVFKIKSPFLEGGRYEQKNFKAESEFWDWFFIANANDPASDFFADFSVSGCWNWLIDSKDSSEFNDIIQRLEASKIGIKPTPSDYDNSPAILVEQLVFANSELNKARAEWQKQKNTESGLPSRARIR